MQTRKLPCPLTDVEYQQRSDTLARLLAEQNDLKDEVKDAAREARVRLDALAQQIAQLGETVLNRAEWREVPISEVKNLNDRVMEIVRGDTGEIIDSRPLSPFELQVEFFPVARADDDMEDQAS